MATVLHLPFNKEPLCQVVPVDVSPLRQSVTLNGNAALVSVEYRHGNASCMFDGSGDYVSVPYSEAFDFGTGDFTIEAWVYLYGNASADAGGYRYAAVCATSPATTGWGFDILGSNSTTGTGLLFESKVSGINQQSYINQTISHNVWHHVAVCRASNVMRFFLDGVKYAGNANITNTISANSAPVWVGRQNVGSYTRDFFGHIDDLRITKGEALYSADFTPPDAIAYTFPPLLGLLDVDKYLSTFQMPSQTRSKLTAFAGSKDIYYGGNGKIVGTTKNTPSAPVSRRVRLHESRSGHLIRESWSDAAGNYSFTHLSRDYIYYVVGFDHTDQYQGVVADKLVPEVM